MTSRNGNERAVVVVDMDGTLADASRREAKYLRRKKKDWPGFFSDMENDPPIREVLERVLELSRTHEIVILTGRPDKYRPQTETWLKHHHVPAVKVLMRRSGDTRPDFQAKADLMRELLESRHVAMALDDREPVCDEYRRLGVNAILIQSDQLNQLVNETYRFMAD